MHDSWVQRVLRRFAAATNLLIPGEHFTVPAEALTLQRTLRAMGAHVATYEGDPPAAPQYLIQLTAGGSGHVVVTAPLDGDPTVEGPSGPLVPPQEHDDAPARLAWARRHMPVTLAAVERLAPQLRGRRIGLSLVLEPKTAVLALELARAGAEVSVYGHPGETRPTVAEALRDGGVAVFADTNPVLAPGLQRDFLAQGLEFLVDDGAHLIRLAHQVPGALDGMVAAAEETTSGLTSLRGFDLRIPVIASNDARSKTLFDNAYGTGQSCLMTILDLLAPNGAWPLHERHVVVAGYGDVGKGFAKMTAAFGARVSIAEPDPVRRLQARMDGRAVGSLVELASTADLLVSATGVRHTVDLPVLRALKDGAAVAVAGGVDQEISLEDAEAHGATWAPIAHRLDALQLPNGPVVHVLDKGECINVTAGEGNPIEIMDLSFGVQAAALGHLVEHAQSLTPGLHPLPRHLDDDVAAATLTDWRPLP
ncbi:MAG: adenosylhomocysteinase [Propionibacteriaceae bacterium]|nr:adenosylhomocysteinase [Propionibacteriaceae bacterium]